MIQKKMLVGGYELIEVVGKGGLGVVYQAYQSSLDRYVALKVLVRKEEVAQQWLDGSRRLKDEAQAAAKVRHPGLVQIFDTGEDAKLGPYIVYEYLPNGTLRQYLNSHKALGFKRAFHLFGRSLLGGLHALHCAGIVHRDVKPENLLSDGAGGYKLGDLGLAHFEDRMARTKTGMLIGTPGYMAPETYLQDNLVYSPAYDIYAAATILVEASLGSHPFAADSPAMRLQRQLKEPVSSQSFSTRDIPLAAATILACAMSVDPQMRPQSAAQLCVELEESLGGDSSYKDVTHLEQIVQSANQSPLSDTKPANKKMQSDGKADNRRRLLTRALFALFIAAILFTTYQHFQYQKGQRLDRGVSAGLEKQIRRLRDDLLSRGKLPTDEEASWIADFVRQAGIAKRQGIANNLSDRLLALTYLARYGAKRKSAFCAMCYFALLRENTIARLREKGLLFEEEIVPAIESISKGIDLAILGLELLPKYCEYKVWGTYALRLSRASVKEAKEKRNLKLDGPQWQKIREPMKTARKLMLKVGWQNYSRENRVAMYDEMLSCSILLSQADISDEVIVHIDELEAAGGPSVIEGIDLREGARLWFRAAMAIVFATDASKKRRDSGIKILSKAIERLESQKGNEVLSARYRCYLSQMMMRCVDGSYDSTNESAHRAHALLNEIKIDVLPQGIIDLIETMHASADTVLNNIDDCRSHLDKVQANRIPKEDRWLYYLTVADYARGHNDYEGLRRAMLEAEKCTPHDFLSYFKTKRTAMGLERTFFGR